MQAAAWSMPYSATPTVGAYLLPSPNYDASSPTSGHCAARLCCHHVVPISPHSHHHQCVLLGWGVNCLLSCLQSITVLRIPCLLQNVQKSYMHVLAQQSTQRAASTHMHIAKCPTIAPACASKQTIQHVPMNKSNSVLMRTSIILANGLNPQHNSHYL